MYFDSASTSVLKQARPFVYIQYPNNNNNNQNIVNQQQPQQQQQQQQRYDHPSQTLDISSPSSSSSSSCSNVSPNLNQYRENSTATSDESKEDEQPKKKKRQHIGYACDKCRERRVGCDRGKPICGQCKDRYTCQYSNHALRLDNVSMRQRLDELENQVGWLTSFVTNLEQDYRTTIPRLALNNNNNGPHVQDTSSSIVTQQQQQLVKVNGPSVVDWAVGTGWRVTEHDNDWKSIFTTIKNVEGFSEMLRNTVQMIYNEKGNPLYRPLDPSSTIETKSTLVKSDLPIFVTHQTDFPEKEHNFTLFESLNRYQKGSRNPTFVSNEDRHLEFDVMTRLIHQHHQCGFPTLVSPSRFENHYRQQQLKPLVLSSVFSHSVPHSCIYHPQLVQIQDFRELGNKFYNHSHDLLGIDEPANLSNIHQRTLLITYDLDLGRVRRAFLHIGIAIRMCFMLNLHRPEGYINCKSAFEREQSKRIFWTVWFYDNMVSYLFHDQLATIKLDQISIDLPTPLPEFNRIELDQTMFAISLIQIRKLAGSISEESRKMDPRALIDRFRVKLWQFYQNLPSHLQFGAKNQILPPDISIWSRRNYFCILLDYCQCWISLYRALLPSSMNERPLTATENEAIQRTSQAAVASAQLFQNWFQCSVQSEDGFDCFFRPYLYHFMSAKNVFNANVSQYGRSPALVYVSRAYLILLLELYKTTPTRKSFDESQLEKDMNQFLATYQIGPNEFAYPAMIDEALMDDPSADGGWSIFRQCQPNSRIDDDVGSRCSSNSSVSDQLIPNAPAELNINYF